MSALHVWRIDSGGERFWVVAADEADALAALHESSMFEHDGEPCDCDVVDMLDDASELTVHDEDDGSSSRKRCAQWVQSEGRGCLGGSVW